MTEAKTLYSTVMKQVFFEPGKAKIYSTGSLDIKGGSDLEYSIGTNDMGKVTCFQVADNNYMWIYRNTGIAVENEEDIATELEIADRDYDVILDCSGAKVFDVTIPGTLGSGGTWWSGETDKSKLHFHHIDPSKKEFTIGKMRNYSLDKIQQEIDKCEVLCAHCHETFHQLNKWHGITLEEYLN
jgi:hypothetical protein